MSNNATVDRILNDINVLEFSVTLDDHLNDIINACCTKRRDLAVNMLAKTLKLGKKVAARDLEAGKEYVYIVTYQPHWDSGIYEYDGYYQQIKVVSLTNGLQTQSGLSLICDYVDFSKAKVKVGMLTCLWNGKSNGKTDVKDDLDEDVFFYELD